MIDLCINFMVTLTQPLCVSATIKVHDSHSVTFSLAIYVYQCNGQAQSLLLHNCSLALILYLALPFNPLDPLISCRASTGGE